MEKKNKDLEKFKVAMEKAVYVSDDLQLKTEIKKRTQVIVSTNIDLYAKFVEKFPKEKVAGKVKTAGKVATVSGILITVLTGGVLSGIGLPMAGAGVIAATTGAVVEDYRHYTLFMDYDNKQVIFVKTKGRNALKLSKSLPKVVD